LFSTGLSNSGAGATVSCHTQFSLVKQLGKMPQMRLIAHWVYFGFNASGASNSNLFGQNAGGSNKCINSNFIGQRQDGATGASYSVCIGYFAGLVLYVVLEYMLLLK
jgi:hypothetical protein